MYLYLLVCTYRYLPTLNRYLLFPIYLTLGRYTRYSVGLQILYC